MDPPMAARVTFLDPEEDAWECSLRSKRELADLPTCLNIVKNIQAKELDRGVSRFTKDFWMASAFDAK